MMNHMTFDFANILKVLGFLKAFILHFPKNVSQKINAFRIIYIDCLYIFRITTSSTKSERSPENPIINWGPIQGQCPVFLAVL